MYQTFFNQYNSANPVELDGPEVAQRVHYILNSNRDFNTDHPRDAAVRQLRLELAGQMPSSSCPVCSNRVAIYPRSIGKGQIRSLAKMSQLGAASRPVSIREIGANGGDHAKLRFWGLVYHQHSPVDGKALGWRLTQNGQKFLAREFSIPKKIYLFQNELIGYSVEEVGILDAQDFTLQSIRASKSEKMILCEQ